MHRRGAARQGRGAGARALAQGGRLAPDSELIAEVLEGNDASHKLFRAARYVRVGAEEYRRPPLRETLVATVNAVVERLHTDYVSETFGPTTPASSFSLLLRSGDPTGTGMGGSDREDLNRCFPGDAKGTMGERLARRIVDLIEKTKPDLLIDLHNERTLKTHTGQILGTPRYMAPERFEGQVTVRSDLYAVGSLLWQLFCGHAPYECRTSRATAAEQLTAAGTASTEKVWRLPLGDAYDKMLNTPMADIKNITGDRGAGSITAAQFLQRFIKEGVKWAHLDIAGTAWITGDNKGATGRPIPLLIQYILDRLKD